MRMEDPQHQPSEQRTWTQQLGQQFVEAFDRIVPELSEGYNAEHPIMGRIGAAVEWLSERIEKSAYGRWMKRQLERQDENYEAFMNSPDGYEWMLLDVDEITKKEEGSYEHDWTLWDRIRIHWNGLRASYTSAYRDAPPGSPKRPSPKEEAP